MVVHLFVAFPGGRLTTRFERRFVRFSYAANVLPWLLLALFWDPHTDWPYIPPDGPGNLLLVDHNPAVSEALNTVVFFVWIGMFVTLAVLLVRRVRRARGPTRRALTPVAVSAAVTVVLFSVASIVDAAGAETATVVLEWLTSVAFGAIPVAFLVGLLRTRLHRSAVADLVVALHGPLTPTQVHDAIAGTLRDESLVLAFWLPDRECYVGPDGTDLDPDGQPGRAVTVLDGDGGRLAALIHDPTLLDDPALIDAVGAAASLALENARLQAELRTQLNEVRASRVRIVEAGDAERRRIERDLHDGAQQRLLGIRLALQLVRGRLADGGAALDGLLTEADGEVVSALEEFAPSPEASTPHCSPTKDSTPPSPRSPDACHSPSNCTCATGGCHRSSRPPPISSPAKPSPTSSNTPTPPERRSTSAAPTAVWRSRSATTESAVPIPTAPGWTGCVTASRQSTGTCASTALRVTAHASRRRSRAGDPRRRRRDRA